MWCTELCPASLSQIVPSLFRGQMHSMTATMYLKIIKLNKKNIQVLIVSSSRPRIYFPKDKGV